jgi:hypothetical protein
MEKINRLMELAGIRQENSDVSALLSAEEMAKELVKQYKHNIQTDNDADHVAGVILGLLKKKGYNDRELQSYATLAARGALRDNQQEIRAKLDSFGLQREEAFKNMRLSGIIKEEEFLGDKSIMSDFLGRELIVRRDPETGILNFEFDSMGWNWDADDALEGAAIISNGKYGNNMELRALPITDADKQNMKLYEFFHWVSGGNKAWHFENVYNIDEDEAIRILEEKFGEEVMANAKAASNLGDLIDLAKEMKERVMEFMAGEYLKNDDEDGELNELQGESNLIMYKGKGITRLMPSGYYEYYSDKEGRFLKFDDLDDCKASIDAEIEEGYID